MQKKRDVHLLLAKKWAVPELEPLVRYEAQIVHASEIGRKVSIAKESEVLFLPPLPAAQQPCSLPTTFVSQFVERSHFMKEIGPAHENDSEDAHLADDSTEPEEIALEEACLDLLSDLAISEIGDNASPVISKSADTDPLLPRDERVHFDCKFLVNFLLRNSSHTYAYFYAGGCPSRIC